MLHNVTRSPPYWAVELSTKEMLVVHMVLKPCERPPKQPMVLLYMV